MDAFLSYITCIHSFSVWGTFPWQSLKTCQRRNISSQEQRNSPTSSQYSTSEERDWSIRLTVGVKLVSSVNGTLCIHLNSRIRCVVYYKPENHTSFQK